MPIEVGKIVKGRVSGITSFGAFIKLQEGKVGLVHISEIADEYVRDVASYLKENQIVKVKVISFKFEAFISTKLKGNTLIVNSSYSVFLPSLWNRY